MLGNNFEGRRLTEAPVDYETDVSSNADNVESPEEVVRNLEELERVLHEDKPASPEEPVSSGQIDLELDQVARELSTSGIEPYNQADTIEDEEQFTESYIQNAKEELERILSPQQNNENTNDSQG